MRVVLDIEANGLKPDKIWIIDCTDIDTGVYTILRRVTDDPTVAGEAREFLERCTKIIGHNVLGYDIPVLSLLLGIDLTSLASRSIDTLVLSKLLNYSRKGHSLEDYGAEYGIPKGECEDFSQYSLELEERCISDVNINERLYHALAPSLDDMGQLDALYAEQEFQLVVNDLSNNGFGFDSHSALVLLKKVEKELSKLDEAIHASFPQRLKLVREITPCYTKHGTLHKKDFRFISDGDLSEFNGGPFCRCSWSAFNPASHKQVIDVLHNAGWRPTERTAGAIETKRKLSRISYNDDLALDIDVQELYDKEQSEEKYGWKINEQNLLTLPPSAPLPAKSLARRILVESRRRTLCEWIGLCEPDQRIHGKFYAIGAWTHRMAHQRPNTANIPNATDTQGKTRLYGAEMRSLWCSAPGCLLVGVDAEGIQLRIFAHYINDPEFTEALVNGRKDNKSDPHSLNQRILGRVCKSRAAAKRFIYALLLGAGIGKLSEVLECNQEQTREALNRLLQRYTGWARLKETIIPDDATKGYFIGLDGRRVTILGNSESERRHLAMSGYLQNGEAVVMKHATLRWYKVLSERGIEFKLVNMVHDEWQTECEEDWNTALIIAQEQANSLRWVGEKFKLHCPLAGSYWSEDLKDYTIGKNWKLTH